MIPNFREHYPDWHTNKLTETLSTESLGEVQQSKFLWSFPSPRVLLQDSYYCLWNDVHFDSTSCSGMSYGTVRVVNSLNNCTVQCGIPVLFIKSIFCTGLRKQKSSFHVLKNYFHFLARYSKSSSKEFFSFLSPVHQIDRVIFAQLQY
jgi:hypothetical protein